jgi:hypothetical protein
MPPIRSGRDVVLGALERALVAGQQVDVREHAADEDLIEARPLVTGVVEQLAGGVTGAGLLAEAQREMGLGIDVHGKNLEAEVSALQGPSIWCRHLAVFDSGPYDPLFPASAIPQSKD